MSSATIKLFLVHGDAKRLRTAELSNWTGKAVAGPRTEFDSILARDEAVNPGVYFLTGVDPESGKAAVYIGEAESIRDRLRSHLSRDFWNHVVFFVSKDETLTKAHVRYLEGRLIEQAKAAGRVTVVNGQASGAKLPESDREDMEIFLARIHQLMPVLGADALVPIAATTDGAAKAHLLFCEIKGLKATGRPEPRPGSSCCGSQPVRIPPRGHRRGPSAGGGQFSRHSPSPANTAAHTARVRLRHSHLQGHRLVHGSRRRLTPACSGLATLAADARRYAAGIEPWAASDAIPTLIRLGPQDRPCERPESPGEGAARGERALSAPCSITRSFTQLLFTSASFRRALRPVASLHQPRLSRVVGHRSHRLVPSLPVLASLRPSRGPAAPTPRAVQAPCFSLFLLSLPRASSRAARWRWPGSPAGNPRSAPPTLDGCLQPASSRAQPPPVRCITRHAADFASLRSLAADAHG